MKVVQALLSQEDSNVSFDDLLPYEDRSFLSQCQGVPVAAKDVCEEESKFCRYLIPRHLKQKVKEQVRGDNLWQRLNNLNQDLKNTVDWSAAAMAFNFAYYDACYGNGNISFELNGEPCTLNIKDAAPKDAKDLLAWVRKYVDGVAGNLAHGSTKQQQDRSKRQTQSHRSELNVFPNQAPGPPARQAEKDNIVVSNTHANPEANHSILLIPEAIANTPPQGTLGKRKLKATQCPVCSKARGHAKGCALKEVEVTILNEIKGSRPHGKTPRQAWVEEYQMNPHKYNVS